MRRIPTLIALLATCLLSTTALAWPGGRGPGDHGGPPHEGSLVERYADRLGLDEATVERIREAARASRAQHAELDDQLREARRALHDTLQQELPDEKAVMAAADRVHALEGERLKHRLASTIEIRKLLSESQRAELVKIMAEKRAEFEERREQHQALVEAACAPEIASFCSETEPGPERGLCLHEQKEQLSEGCRVALSRGHHHKRRR